MNQDLKTWLSRFLIMACLALGLGACGGHIEFVSPKTIEPPPKPPEPKIFATEEFLHGIPTGIPVVLFHFYPNKTMRSTVTQLEQRIEFFHRRFWKNYQHYDEIRMGFLMDSENYDSAWWLSIQEENPIFTSLAFLKKQLGRIRSQLGFAGVENTSFYSPLEKAIRETAETHPWPVSDKIWLHALYFRDRDIPWGAASPETYKAAVNSMWGAGISRFRFNIHAHMYLDKDSSCLPSSQKIGARLQQVVKQYQGMVHELCELSGDDLEELARNIEAQHLRLVLGQRPVLESLTVQVNEETLPKEEIAFNEQNNEVLFRETAPTLYTGDQIKIRYEVKKVP